MDYKKKITSYLTKLDDEKDEEFVRSKIPAEDLLGFVHYNSEVIDADRQGLSPFDESPTAKAEIEQIKAKIDEEANQ